MQESDHELFRKSIDGASTFVLTTHINPDGDALGSQLGLAKFLRSQGKQVRLINDDPTPPVLSFLEDPDLPVEVYSPSIHDSVLQDVERIILVDNSAPDRLGTLEHPMLGFVEKVLCIDHHPSRNSPWADQIVDERSCATAVMIYDLVRADGWVPDLATAEAIYVGLATDTGFFRFNSTNAKAHEVAAELVKLGVRPARSYEEIYERNSEAFTRLLGHALAGLTMSAGGAIAVVRIDRKMLEDLNAEDVDTSEINTALLAMDGLSVALLFREQPGGKVKVSLRSKGKIDVHLLASEFGGGGHRNASGIVMAGELDHVVRTVTDRTVALLG